MKSLKFLIIALLSVLVLFGIYIFINPNSINVKTTTPKTEYGTITNAMKTNENYDFKDFEDTNKFEIQLLNLQGNKTKYTSFNKEDLIKRLINGGNYQYTLNSSFWVIKQDPKIIYNLDDLLEKYQEFKDLGAYPFNIIWALAQIGGDDSILILKKHQGKIIDYAKVINLAVKAINLRKIKGTNYGYLLLDQVEVRSFPSKDAPVIKKVVFGTELKLSLRMIKNLREEGLKGPNQYDEVVLGDNQMGYILRSTDNFPVFM